MAQESEQNVLKRMAEAGRPRLSFSALSPAKALRIGMAKAARDALRLALVVDKLSEERLSLAELLDSLEDRALLAVLTGPAEGLGLAVLSPQVLAGIVEMQTTGKVNSNEAPSRRPTRTDATMAVEFIDRSLVEMETMLAGEMDVIWAGGFRYSSFLNDPRPLGLLLEDAAYRVFRLDLDLALGNKRGQMLLAFPAIGRGDPPERKGGSTVDPGEEWSRNLESRLLGTPAQLDAVLHRLTIPLQSVMALQAGDMLLLPMAKVERVRLEGVGGGKLVGGKLGQARGHRAVRLSLDDAEAVAQAIVSSAERGKG